MPIYEYKCKKCDKEQEKFLLNSSEEPEPCEDCGSDELERILSVHGKHVSWSTWQAGHNAQ